jgi:hypothetical protein
MRIVTLLCAAIGLAAPVRAQSSHTVFAGVFTTPLHKDAPSENPWGLTAAATFAAGHGVEARWATTDASKYWSLGFMQILPSVRGAKTVQPFGSLGVGRLSRSGDDTTCISAAGGVITFIGGHLGLGVDLRYLLGTSRLGPDKVRERHVSFELLWRF